MSARRTPTPTTAFDRVALFFGCGVIGAVTGLCAGLALLLAGSFAAVHFLGASAGTICVVYLPLAVAAVCAVGGLLLPDATADLLGRSWGWIVALLFGP
jgi:hypothetical protein